MASKIFIDTGAYLGIFSKHDSYHQEATRIWEVYQNENISFYTTNHILDELATLLSRRTNNKFSTMKLREIYKSNTIIERPTEEDELRALEYFKKYADQKVSFTDCLSFMVMENLGISQVFTFDRHFAYAGFDVVSS